MNLFVYTKEIYWTCLKNFLNFNQSDVGYASIHLTNEVKRISKHLSFELQYLPPCCPHLAPIELIFGAVKRRISNQKNKNLIDFSKLSGKKAIVNSLEHISTEICMNFWRKFIKEAKASIMSARDTIKEQRIINKYNEERKNNILDYKNRSRTDNNGKIRITSYSWFHI